MDHTIDAEHHMWNSIAALEHQLNLPTGFYERLSEEDDWSFIIKLHSLVEAAITNLVTVALGDDKLRDLVSYLELSNKRTGKMAVVSALGLLDTQYRAWISKLSELRNEFAHNVSSVSMNLNQLVDKPGKIEAYSKSFCLGIDKIDFDDRKLSNIEYVREDVKYVIWITGALCLAIIKTKAEQISETRELKVELTYKKGQIQGIEDIVRRIGIDFKPSPPDA